MKRALTRWAFLAAFFFGIQSSQAEDLRPTPDEVKGEQQVSSMGDPLLDSLSPEERRELYIQWQVETAKRAAARGDVLGWGAALFPDKFNLPFCMELHGYLVAIRHDSFTSTEAPRGHAKTTVACFLNPIYTALNEPWAYDHYLNIQATDDKALSINRTIKLEFEENLALKRLYGDVRGSRWTDQQFVIVVTRPGKSHEIVFTSRSAGQSIRGINYRNKRPCYIMVDDLYNEDDLNNPDSTDKKNGWFNGALMNARAKNRKSCVHFLGTAVNNYDLFEKHKKNAKTEATPGKRWKCRTFQAIKDWDAFVVLWPDLNTFESLMQDREDMGSLIFAREMQNERWDEESAIVKRSWLLPPDGTQGWEIDPEDLEFSHLPGKMRLVAVRIGNDPSIGQKTTNDFNGVALVYVGRVDGSKANSFYIIDLWNERLSMEKRAERLQGIKDAQPPTRAISQCRIEGVAGFMDYVAFVRSKTNLPVREVKQVQDKITVLQNKSKHFENRRVFISKRIAPALKDELLYQLTTNHPKFDDLRDALLLTIDDTTDWGNFL